MRVIDAVSDSVLERISFAMGDSIVMMEVTKVPRCVPTKVFINSICNTLCIVLFVFIVCVYQDVQSRK